MSKECISNLVPRPLAPRFYQLRDKMREWPGDEAIHKDSLL